MKIFLASSSAKWGAITAVIIWLLIIGGLSSIAPPLSEVTTNEPEEFLPAGSEAVEAMQLRAEKFPADATCKNFLRGPGKFPAGLRPAAPVRDSWKSRRRSFCTIPLAFPVLVGKIERRSFQRILRFSIYCILHARLSDLSFP